MQDRNFSQSLDHWLTTEPDNNEDSFEIDEDDWPDDPTWEIQPAPNGQGFIPPF